MKKILLLSFIALTFGVNAQNVGIGTNTPKDYNKLEVFSTESGFQLPRMTTDQRATLKGNIEALSAPLSLQYSGMMVYDLTNNTLYMWDASKSTNGDWVNVLDADASLADADADATNELQNLSNSVSGTDRTINISGGTGTTISVADNDNDSSNEYNTNVTLTGTTLNVIDDGGTQSQDLSSLENDNWYEVGQTRGADNISDNIYTNGNVGIGLSSAPQDRLHIQNAGSLRAFIENTSTGYAGIRFKNSLREYFTGLDTNTDSYIIYDNTSFSSRFIVEGDGSIDIKKGILFNCDDCGSNGTLDGTANWGDLTIQGRVVSANSNLHLSPPGGSNVVINDVYRAAGGTTAGSAGLQVQNLEGTGNRMVSASADGTLYASTQVISGSVQSTGAIAGGTGGFTVSKTGTGQYEITFTIAFSSLPGASATQVYPDFANFGAGGATTDNAIITGLSSTKIKVVTGDGGGSRSDRDFTFVVIGVR